MPSSTQDALEPTHHLPRVTRTTFISTDYVSPYSIPKHSPYSSGNSAMPTNAQTPPIIKFRVSLNGGRAQQSAASPRTSSRVAGQANPPAASPKSPTAGLWHEWYAKWINRFWGRLRQEGIDLRILPDSCGEAVTPDMIASTNVSDPVIALVHYLVNSHAYITTTYDRNLAAAMGYPVADWAYPEFALQDRSALASTANTTTTIIVVDYHLHDPGPIVHKRRRVHGRLVTNKLQWDFGICSPPVPWYWSRLPQVHVSEVPYVLQAREEREDAEEAKKAFRKRIRKVLLGKDRNEKLVRKREEDEDREAVQKHLSKIEEDDDREAVKKHLSKIKECAGDAADEAEEEEEEEQEENDDDDLIDGSDEEDDSTDKDFADEERDVLEGVDVADVPSPDEDSPKKESEDERPRIRRSTRLGQRPRRQYGHQL